MAKDHGWIDVATIRALFAHALNVTAALALVYGVGKLAEYLLADGQLLQFVKHVEAFVLGGLLIWFAIQLGYILWKDAPWRSNASLLLVAAP